MAETPNTDSDSKKDLVSEAKARFKLAEDASRRTVELAREDLDFKAGIQWDAEMLEKRRRQERPCLTINRLPQYSRQITNEQKQNQPSIKVSPVDSKADPDTAKIIQGMFRHIERISNAKSAYGTAYEQAVDGGFGYFRIITEYEDPRSFLQHALIKRIPNQFTVKLDPNSLELDGSDANWGMIAEDIPKDDYEAQYGDSELCKGDNWASEMERSPDWVRKDSCRVVEYFYKDFKDETLLLFDDGSTLTEKEYDAEIENGRVFEAEVVNKRKTTIPVVKWAKIAGNEVLEETEFPSQWIPIIPVYGAQTFVDGYVIYEGVIRHAKDPQRMYNFWVSAETEAIALAPKAPFIVEERQIEGHENEWASANTETYAYLKYKSKDSNGDTIEAQPPQRNVYEPPVQAITSARVQSAEDIKATTGIYDAAMGNRSNETSGRAIERRVMQAQTSNYHFVDNLALSIKHCGRILLEVIPVIYDTARAQRILGEDGEAEIVEINRLFKHKGQEKLYDPSLGKYDISVDIGPSYETKRQESVASILEIVRSSPDIMAKAGDILLNYMDWPGSKEIAERLKKTMPPGLVEDSEKQPIPPQVIAQMQQQGEMIQSLTMALNQANQKLQNKSLELESKERIASMNNETDLVKEVYKANAAASQAVMAAELSEINQWQASLGLPNQNQNFNGGTPDQMSPQFNQNPTGGQSPGPSMGV